MGSNRGGEASRGWIPSILCSVLGGGLGGGVGERNTEEVDP